MREQLNEELSEIMEKLEGNAVIVEGKKDKAAIEHFGIRNVIILTKPLFQIIEEISSKYESAAILTDLDKEGKSLYGKLAIGLQRQGVHIDNTLRNFLFKKTKLRQIEGMRTYFQH